MLFIQHDAIVETLAPDTPDDPRAVGILPGAAWRNLHLFAIQVLDTVLERGPVDRIPVSE